MSSNRVEELLPTLKSCPFCGSKLIYEAKHETLAHPEDASGCIASALLIFDSDDASFWNTRASVSTAISPDGVEERVAVIHGRGPNTPAMMICARLAEQGVLVPIEMMEGAVAAISAEGGE